MEDIVKEEKLRDTTHQEMDLDESDGSVACGERPLVTLSTIHSAKRGEWDQVILIDFFEEAMPGKPQPERIGYDPEEAKRLFYAAITRAIHRLDILSVEAYHGNSEEVSSFVRDYACVCDEICEVPAIQRKHTSSILSGCLSSSVCAIEPSEASILSILDGRHGRRCCWRDLNLPSFLAASKANRQTCTPFSGKGVQI